MKGIPKEKLISQSIAEVDQVVGRLGRRKYASRPVTVDLLGGVWYEILDVATQKRITFCIKEDFNHSMRLEVINAAVQDLKKAVAADE